MLGGSVCFMRTLPFTVKKNEVDKVHTLDIYERNVDYGYKLDYLEVIEILKYVIKKLKSS